MKRLTLALALSISGCTSTDFQLNPILARNEYEQGLAFLYGEGQAKNPHLALDHFQRSALHGSDEAEYALGWMYMTGEGVAENPAKAEEWLRKSAWHANTDAQASLGAFYSLQENYDESARWFTEAAQRGNIPSQQALGLLLINGKSFKINRAQVESWLLEQKRDGNQKAKELLTILASTPKFCGSLANLFFNLERKPERDCIYTNALQNGVVVTQVTMGNLLVNLYGMNEQTMIVFKSRDFGKDIVDGTPLPAGNFKYVGPYTYNSVFGSRTVYSFKPN